MRYRKMREWLERQPDYRGRDMRNPYGSRGGYVVSDRRRMRDYASGRMGDYVDDREHSSMGSDRNYRQSDYARNRYDRQQSRQYNRDYRGYDRNYQPDMRDYGDMNYGRYDYYGGYDYGDDEFLSDEELMDWSKDLLKEIDEKDKPIMTREHITQRAKDMGVKFKDYTEDELVVATLMAYTDYKKTLGTGNVDLYIRLGKDWLEDEDSELKGGEKLATYYDEIICAE